MTNQYCHPPIVGHAEMLGRYLKHGCFEDPAAKKANEKRGNNYEHA